MRDGNKASSRVAEFLTGGIRCSRSRQQLSFLHSLAPRISEGLRVRQRRQRDRDWRVARLMNFGSTWRFRMRARSSVIPAELSKQASGIRFVNERPYGSQAKTVGRCQKTLDASDTRSLLIEVTLISERIAKRVGLFKAGLGDGEIFEWTALLIKFRALFVIKPPDAFFLDR